MWVSKRLQHGSRSFYRYKEKEVHNKEGLLDRKLGEESYSFDVMLENMTYLWLDYLYWDGDFEVTEASYRSSELYAEHNKNQSFKLELTKRVKKCCILSQAPNGKRTLLKNKEIDNFGLTFKQLNLEVVGIDDVGLGRTVELRLKPQTEWNENTFVVSFLLEKEEKIESVERHGPNYDPFWLADCFTITLGKT